MPSRGGILHRSILSSTYGVGCFLLFVPRFLPPGIFPNRIISCATIFPFYISLLIPALQCRCCFSRASAHCFFPDFPGCALGLLPLPHHIFFWGSEGGSLASLGCCSLSYHMDPSRFTRICPQSRPYVDGSSSSVANGRPESTGGWSCTIDEPSSSNCSARGSAPTGSSSAIGDHFCPIVPACVARMNRKKRQTARRARLILRQGPVPHSLSMRATCFVPKEYMQVLKATYLDRFYYGGPDYECNHCAVLFWYQERVVSQSSHRAQRISYNLCCRAGKISLPAPKPFPPILQDLIRFDGTSRSNSFMQLIRQYNSLFAFTSLGANIDNNINTGNGPYVFRINGVVHHRIGSLIPAAGQRPEYAQLYIYDTSHELQNRLNIFDRTDNTGDVPDPAIVQELISMLDQCNPLVQQFRLARDRLLFPSAPEVAIKLIGSGHSQSDRYSLPTASELAALIIPGASCEASKFDVIVQKNSGQLCQLSPIHPALLSLQYPLLFPYGDVGFHIGIKHKEVDDQPPDARDEVSMLEYYRYHSHYRKGEPNPFTCCGQLSDQLAVNGFSCIETSRLTFHSLNQTKLRSETHQGIADAVGRGDSEGKDVGTKVILPSSFTGGRRYMVQNYHDSMAICRSYGPQICSTFTCNPKWPEIIEAIRFEPGQKPSDRSDMVTRVYHMKLDEYIASIKSGEAFGPIQAVVYTVEFQKRGLPHSHTLTWLTAQFEEPSLAFIDNLICAEIPDITTDMFGFGLVDEFMIHGSCGEHNPSCPCMKDGRCSKGYPKQLCDATTIDDDGYPIYRRRNDGRYVVKNGVPLDNRWVVPYNPALLKKFQAHINVKWCNKTYLVKYLFKYVNKGGDSAMFTFRQNTSEGAGAHSANNGGIDEIMQYIKSRYLSTCESFWRLYGFEIHGRTPSVARLVVHLPNMQFMTYHEEADLGEVMEDPDSSRTMLTEWFVANKRHIFARGLTYCLFPSKFSCDPNKKVWTKRRRGTKIGRLRHIHPSSGEPFYLRMLLML
ncbi:uncharacterized protein LOC102722064 isoform X3 [Oryza brachyantha]|uniref:uncharacterized protein LOC102722064 isoform X3 n=1 Tax=Oryza brachyantha TaxID=4533 RepID=UPI001ADCEF2C|nr:uncharacterized protein LOC102722064 isoform X3 [Oryza brachyantha]XP_040385741.1 uncharacterized protein LOC102722064 isoform X3 [Oryza brachyantha]XP_040385742.1 uncharacterized protein LOC102722064 isoform X3 [Oryza brachyantha]